MCAIKGFSILQWQIQEKYSIEAAKQLIIYSTHTVYMELARPCGPTLNIVVVEQGLAHETNSTVAEYCVVIS